MTDFTLRPLTVPERKYTYAQSSQLQGQTGNIGYLRGDFGSSGDQFYTTWFDTRPQWKSDEFKLDCSSLETIYEKFNIDHPADYKGRSLSVSDVVEIRESDTLNPGFYFVDSIGFKSISFDKSLCKEPVEAGSGKISVLLVEPNKYPKMIEIDDTLEAMQAVVGGDIEEYMPFEDEVAIICNEEGKVNGLPPNRAVYEENSREMQDIICGKFFVAYAPFEAEKFQSLPPDLAEKYREKFKYPERFMRVNNEIVAVPFKPVRADKER